MSYNFENVFRALANALASLLHPKMLALVLWPVLLALVIWGGLVFWFWHDWVNSASAFLASTSVDSFLLRFEIHGLAAYLAVILALLLLFPCILITALLVAFSHRHAHHGEACDGTRLSRAGKEGRRDGDGQYYGMRWWRWWCL
ncbi:MAG TPA: EI24 domain-containing protein [Burkholderiales bacterium]|nr:EI24 domain-containing protein [Burkholderiales bacterium]